MVSDVDLLTTALERNHRNTIVSAMLVDELMDTRDMLRSEAEAHVAKVVEDVAAGPVWYAASEVLRTMSKAKSRRLWKRITSACGASEEFRAGVSLRVGDAPPAAVFVRATSSYRHDHWEVTISAEWLLDQDL